MAKAKISKKAKVAVVKKKASSTEAAQVEIIEEEPVGVAVFHDPTAWEKFVAWLKGDF
jgi:hypothetical protein